MASSVNAKLLAACRGFIRFGSGLVSPAVTLAACARRANRLLPRMKAANLDDQRPGRYQAFSHHVLVLILRAVALGIGVRRDVKNILLQYPADMMIDIVAKAQIDLVQYIAAVVE